jgi:hypothetical protein
MNLTGRNKKPEKPHKWYFSLNIIRETKSRKIKWVGHVACIRRRNCIPEGTRLLEKPKHRQEGNTKMNPE